ncbi:hypothetical protein SAMN05444156_1661 [Verrucomicrobium sp. GAS474]|uniref:hypothetical protein n=1 Tax=Verrucomicrobium sp. GAS474 TaxID=1882831 RepID=UPI000879F25F|nr:hypothetical protein [Verrucomicrobium sp. GAS474]SDU04871.1 hypothetical protein SAMN05444156_1661 [Verrucomicrobium sp. GAS474]
MSISTRALFTIQHGGIPNLRDAIQTEVDQIEGNRLLNTDVEALVKYFVDRFSVDVPVLNEAAVQVHEPQEVRVDLSGDHRFSFRGNTRVMGDSFTIEVPFTGDSSVFNIRPNPFSFNPPHGAVKDGIIFFYREGVGLRPEEVRSEYQNWIASVRQNLAILADNFKEYAAQIEGIAREIIERRRKKLLAAQNVAASLGLPMKPRQGATPTYTVPAVKKKIAPTLPPSSSAAFKPEPAIDENIYQHILGVIESMVHVMERSPRDFQNIGEETLRSHFLVALNSHYEGRASGETFNGAGKTDILIRENDRNVFIAECKFWGGPQQLTETIDQLLGYLVWRDSKAAILLFNRNKDFSKVLASIEGVVEAHPNFVKNEGKQGSTRFRYRLRHKDDPSKTLHVTILAFDIPRTE